MRLHVPTSFAKGTRKKTERTSTCAAFFSIQETVLNLNGEPVLGDVSNLVSGKRNKALKLILEEQIKDRIDPDVQCIDQMPDLLPADLPLSP